MKHIYIAHPISGDIQGNIQKVLAIFRNLALTPDIVPHAPYIVALQAIDDKIPEERFAGIKINNDIIASGVIQEVWVYGPKISPGVKEEIDIAHSCNIPVIFQNPLARQSIDQLRAVNTSWEVCSAEKTTAWTKCENQCIGCYIDEFYT